MLERGLPWARHWRICCTTLTARWTSGTRERHLVTRQVYKQRRSAALAEWSALAA